MHAQCAFVCTHKPKWKRFRHHRQNNGFEWQNFMFVDLVLARDYCWQYTHCHHCYHHYYYSTSFAVSVRFGLYLPLSTRSGIFFNCSICYFCVTRRVFRIHDQTVSLSPKCAKVWNVISFIHQQQWKTGSTRIAETVFATNKKNNSKKSLFLFRRVVVCEWLCSFYSFQ